MARHRAAAMPGGPILERVRLAPPPTPAELERILSERLADSRQHLQRLFYGLALSTSETVLDCVDELVPGRQVLLGTDYPFAQEVGVTTTLAGLERHPGFDEADRAAIESGNARRLFPRWATYRSRQVSTTAATGGVPMTEQTLKRPGVRSGS